MNLIQVREKFRELSGRYDLVDDDLSDNGADFYINEASKWLDRLAETTKSYGSFMIVINAGDWSVRFPFARAIKEVWMSTAEGKWQLEKIRLQDLIAAYFTEPPAEWENGTPLYYSPALSRYIPEPVSSGDLTTFASYAGVMTNTNLEYDAIILACPIDQDALVEIQGLFYNRLLEADGDENYWSISHPMLLIEAAIRQTYKISGNAAMLKISNAAIASDLVEIDKDFVEQMIAELDQMEG